MDNPLRILIVDDQRRARQSLKALIATNFKAAELREAASAAEALRQVAESQPQVVIMDAHMPDVDGIEATRQIRARAPQVHVIVLSLYPEYQAPALAAGAEVFVSKGDPPERLLAAIVSASKASGPEVNDGAPV